MPLSFHPNPGTVLICDYETGFKAPEMVKRRPVIVVSPRLRQRDKLCTVVPLSTTVPDRLHDYHCQVNIDLPEPYSSAIHWVKADMLATVAFHRLKPFHTGKDQEGKRKHLYPSISPEALMQIRECIKRALGMT